MKQARFWSHVRRTGGCWLWEGSLDPCGYGRVRRHGAIRSAHRVAYEFTYGLVPPNALVRQRCGERACCRPDHLELVPIIRLTPDQVRCIRASLHGSIRLSRLYGVSDRHIRRLRLSIQTT